MLTFKTNLNLSDRATVKLAASLSAGTSSRKVIEPGLKFKLSAKAHSVDDFLSYKELSLVTVKSNEVLNTDAVVIYCQDMPGSIKCV